MSRNGADGIPDVLIDTSIDESVFRVLSERPRRYALYVLLDRESIETSELVDILTGWLHTAGYGMAGPKEREQIQRDFYHVHLPLMVDAGLIECIEGCTVVELAPLRVRVLELLQWSRAHDQRISQNTHSAANHWRGRT